MRPEFDVIKSAPELEGVQIMSKSQMLGTCHGVFYSLKFSDVLVKKRSPFGHSSGLAAKTHCGRSTSWQGKEDTAPPASPMNTGRSVKVETSSEIRDSEETGPSDQDEDTLSGFAVAYDCPSLFYIFYTMCLCTGHILWWFYCCCQATLRKTSRDNKVKGNEVKPEDTEANHWGFWLVWRSGL